MVTRSPYWSWARLLLRVFALDMVHCPWCQRGTLRLLAVITQGAVIRKILRHLKLSAAPLPLRLPVLAKHHVTGSPKAATTRAIS